MRPYVKVVIKFEYKVIVGKFVQDKAKATQRLPKTIENMFRRTDGHKSLPFRIIKIFLGSVR